MLAAKSFVENHLYKWLIVSDLLTGNSYDGPDGYPDIYDAIERQAAVNDGKFEAFTRWQDALQWLLDNDPARDA